MTVEAWTEIQREEVFRKYSRKIDRIDYKLPNGEEADFYIKAEMGAAAILALTTDNEVILARQFRPGPNAILDELPGGMIDPGESGLEAIQREFLEETGYVGDFEFVGMCLDDAYSTMDRHCFVATNCKKVAEPEVSATETTEVVLMPLTDFRKHLRSGRMTDIEVGYIGLDYLGKL